MTYAQQAAAAARVSQRSVDTRHQSVREVDWGAAAVADGGVQVPQSVIDTFPQGGIVQESLGSLNGWMAKCCATGTPVLPTVDKQTGEERMWGHTLNGALGRVASKVRDRVCGSECWVLVSRTRFGMAAVCSAARAP